MLWKGYTHIDCFSCHVLSVIHYFMIIYEFLFISLFIASYFLIHQRNR